MAEESRRLAAVMLTDMVGYSSLAQRDERLALDLGREQDLLVRAMIAEFGGTTVKSLGDGILAEFGSALEAVRCALTLQAAIERRNSAVGVTPIRLRVGIHLGDVEHRDGDVYGDAVNIVSRVEPHADHGGICVSQQVCDQVRNKLEATFESIGTPRLKGIEHSIELYRVVMPGSSSAASGSSERAKGDGAQRIVVLPFANISPDPDDEYFADGMTEELIEKLAHVGGLRVIARTTAMHYKRSERTAGQIGRELGVALVLECSVRKVSKRVRITAQLIDAASEEHLWADRYDRDLDDIFQIQDEIAREIASAITTRVAESGGSATLEPPPPSRDTEDLDAYTDYLQGRELLRRRGSIESMRTAQRLFERAIDRDPAFARAHVALGEVLLWLSGEAAIPFEEAEERAAAELSAAIALDETIAEAHSVIAGSLLGLDDLEGAKREALRAKALNPSLSDPYRWLAQIEAGNGNIDGAVELLEEARTVDPLDVNVLAFLGRCYFYAGRIDDALAHWDHTEALVGFRTNAYRAEYCLSVGDLDGVEAAVERMHHARPGTAWELLYRGVLAARRDDGGALRSSYDQLRAIGEDSPVATFMVGFLDCVTGDLDEYFACMHRVIEQHSLPLLEVTYSPLYAAARDDPRYEELLAAQRAVVAAASAHAGTPGS